MKRHPIDSTVITTILVAAIAAFASWSVAKWQSEKQAAVLLTFAKEKFDTRLSEYPKLWTTLAPLSRRADEKLTADDAHKVARELNAWLYDRGGLIAGPTTRKLVYNLRNACFDWTGGDPNGLHELKTQIHYSCRNDLSLVSQDEVKTGSVNVDERNDRIRKLQEKAGVVDLPGG